MADAAYMRGNQTSACEWWEQVDYDSLIGLDPWEICSRVTSPEPASSVTNARPEPDEAAPRNMTTTFAEVASLSPPSALANHGFPRFGMTPAEVVAASSGAMSRVAGRVGSEVFNLSMLAEGSLNTGEKMMFYFAKSDESLALVKVIPPPVHAAHLTLDCPEIWGNPLETENKEWAPGFWMGLMRWQVANGDLVTLSWTRRIGEPDACHILIQPSGTRF